MAKEHHSFNLLNIVLLASVLVLFVYVLNLSNSVSKLTSQTSENDTITSVSYTCDEGKTIQAQFFDDKAEVELGSGRSMLLMQGVSGSGVRYTNGDESFTFWTKGNTAFVEEGPESTVTYNNCVEVTPTN